MWSTKRPQEAEAKMCVESIGDAGCPLWKVMMNPHAEDNCFEGLASGLGTKHGLGNKAIKKYKIGFLTYK